MKIDAYYDGVFCSRECIKIPLTDRCVFFGDGIYDAAIGRNGKIFMLKEHIKRFISNANALSIPLGKNESEIKGALLRLASLAPYDSYFVYFQLSRRSPERTHAYPDSQSSSLLITLTPFRIAPYYHALNLTAAEDIRYFMCNIKTLNLLPAVIASTEAANNGFDETVLHRGRIVTECAHSNVHIIKNGALITHPLTNLILPGISRAHLLATARDYDIRIHERPFTLDELHSADEVLVTSSSKICLRAERFLDTRYRLTDDSIGSLLCKKMHEDFLTGTS